jgi:hypothetical protein
MTAKEVIESGLKESFKDAKGNTVQRSRDYVHGGEQYYYFPATSTQKGG